MAGNSYLALFLLFSCIFLVDFARADFTFEVEDSPTQCGPLTIKWTGGVAPFRLIVVIPTETDINMTIPDSSFQNGKGSYTVPELQVPSNKQLLFAMSDATGGTAGGTTSLMTVGNAVNGKTCNTTLRPNDFFFIADDTLTQCSTFRFQEYKDAQLPITIHAWIPGGSDSFVVPVSPPNAPSFGWTANVTAQSSVIFSMIDSRGRTGGTDKIRIVAGSNDKSCITVKPGSPSTGQDGEHPTGNRSETKGISSGAIAGIAIAAALVIGLLGGLLFWLTKRRNNRYDGPRPLNLADEGDYSQRPPPDSSYPMLTPFTVAPTGPNRPQEFDPYVIPTPPPPIHGSQGPTPLSPTSSGTYPTSTYPTSTHYQESTTGSSSAALTSRSRKLVVHRDAEDDLDEPEDLPPSYVDRRPPNASTSLPRKN